MNINLSPESSYVASNWNTVTEIFEATQQLKRVINQFLLSFEEELKTCDWWSDEWIFKTKGSNQIYISRKTWYSGGTYLVWIGIEDFEPKNVFGQSNSPQLYVYICGKNHVTLIKDLIDALDEKENRDQSQKNYAVREELQKFSDGEVDNYLNQIRKRVLEFFTHFGQQKKWDDIIQQYISTLKVE